MIVDDRIEPRKSLGQHFLTDSRLAASLIAVAGLAPGQEVIEIGPGEGVLTGALLAHGLRVAAVEIDTRLGPGLERRFGHLTDFHLILADALTLDFSRLVREAGFHPPVTVVGNFPYNVGTPLIRTLIALRGTVRGVAAMLQDEVARRMAARPGERPYGYLSVFCQYYAIPSLGPVIRPGAFRPPPKVLSRIVRLNLRDEPLLGTGTEGRFLELISHAFRHPRKTLANNLAGTEFRSEDIKQFLAARGYSPLARPGELDLAAWLDLSGIPGQPQGAIPEVTIPDGAATTEACPSPGLPEDSR